jgi:Protein of unknown function (DUF4199)
MKRTVITFGVLSGAVSSAMMLLTLPFLDQIGFDRGEILGYTMIVASFLLVFFGVRSYRENVAGGSLTFGRAFVVGLLITLISCAFYVVTWEIIYFKLAPGFADKWAAYTIEKARASGASQESIEATTRQMRAFKENYDKPLIDRACRDADIRCGTAEGRRRGRWLKRSWRDLGPGRVSARSIWWHALQDCLPQSGKYFADFIQKILAVRALERVDVRVIPTFCLVSCRRHPSWQLDWLYTGEESRVEEERK